MIRTIVFATLLSPALIACGDPGGSVGGGEFISRVELTFTPTQGTPVTFRFDDPDGDGGSPGTSDAVSLTAGSSYELSIRFLNALEDPLEDITEEVRDEAVEHQVFLTGSAVVGPATTNSTGPLMHAYADTDAAGQPLGLLNTITASAGSGDLVVTLRHMPPEMPPEKSSDTAAQVATSGFAAIGGENDAQVTFAVTAQ